MARWNAGRTGAEIAADPALRAALVPFWAAGETVTAGTVRMAPTGETIRRTADGTTGATYDATEAALWSVVAGAGGVDSAPATLTELFGYRDGAGPSVPGPSAPRGREFWSLDRFSTYSNTAAGTLNTSTLTPSLTATGSNVSATTRIDLGVGGNEGGGGPWRFLADVTTTANATSSLRLSIALKTANGTDVVPAVTVVQAGAGTAVLDAHRMLYEVKRPAASTLAVRYMDVILTATNSGSVGTISLSNVSVRRVERDTPKIKVAWDRVPAAGAQLQIDVPTGLDDTGNLRRVRHFMQPDNALELGYGGGNSFSDAMYTPAGAYRWSASTLIAGAPNTVLHVSNNGPIIGVYKTDGTTELLGNTHTGESGRTGTFTTDYEVYCDHGDGVWVPLMAFTQHWSFAFRVKVIARTKYQRNDQSTPFANFDRTYVFFHDGTVRVSQTMTFLADQKLDLAIWHMLSGDPANGRSRFTGRIGTGRTILGEVDYNERLPAPAQSSNLVAATTGGTLPTGIYSMRVTALSVAGETTASPAWGGTGGGTSVTGPTGTLTMSWGAVTGATGYNVYFGYPGNERFVARVPAGTTTYTVTGSETPGAAVPTSNSASTANTVSANAGSDQAEWSVYRDTVTGTCWGLSLDREAVLAFPNVAGIRTDISRDNGGTIKHYWSLRFAGTDLPYTVPAGTEWTSDVWFFYYQPANPNQYETEIALRAAGGPALAAAYPAI